MKTEDIQALYQKLLVAYRDLPAQHKLVAREAGTDAVTAEQAWHRGLAGQEPLRDVIEAEAAAARAKRLREEADLAKALQDDQLKAKTDAIDARSKEAQGARLTRENAIVMGVAASRMLKSALAVTEEIQRRVAAGLTTMSLDDLRRLLHTAGAVTDRAQQVFRGALEIERLVQGEPIATIGLRVDKMEGKELEQEFLNIAKSLERAAKLGGHTSTLTPLVETKPKRN